MTLKEWLEANPITSTEDKNYAYIMLDGYAITSNYQWEDKEELNQYLDYEVVDIKINDKKINNSFTDINELIIQKPKQDYFKIEQFKERCEEILNAYGHHLQIIQTIQEMSELTKELTRYYKMPHLVEVKTSNFVNNVIDEFADVYIMLQQMKIALNISEYEVGKKIDEKLTRQIKRMENEKNE